MKYLVGQKLGESGYAQVRLITEKETGRQLAVKMMNVKEYDKKVSPFVSSTLEKAAQSEIRIWQEVCSSPCEHINRFLEAYREKFVYYMVCDLCTCLLLDKVVTEEDLSDLPLSNVFKQMLKALAHLHGLSIVHRDVKPGNFLWGGPEGKTVQLAGFELATKVPTGGKLYDVCGTSYYMAPEMLLLKGVDCLADIWSLGATAYLLVYGNLPYAPAESQLTSSSAKEPIVAASRDAVEQAIANDMPPLEFRDPKDLELFYSTAAVEFIQSLLQRDPVQRPAATQALNHAFLEEVTTPVAKAQENSVKDFAIRVQSARMVTMQHKAKPDPRIQSDLEEQLQIPTCPSETDAVN